ncbi:hypothetical protein DFH06DRAFT_1210994 [Mycena polygramma]|nr:hypothetical protein DFH06DRAFT_1210994 [Mycena polygramma]
MSAPQRTRRRVAVQPQLVPQNDPPAAAADDDDDPPAAEDEQDARRPKRTRKGKGKKTQDDEDFDAASGAEQESGSDDDEPITKKPKPTTATKPKAGGKKKSGETDGAKATKAPVKAPAKRNTTAAAKPVAKSGPAVSANVGIASEARVLKWRADLDLARAHRELAVAEAKADFYLTATELGTRLIGLVDLHTVDTLATLRGKGVLGKDQTLPRFELPPPPDAPPLPNPFESIWLLGKILRSPLEGLVPPVEGADAEAGPSTTGAATTSTMLVGVPALVADETPGSPTQSREEEDEG